MQRKWRVTLIVCVGVFMSSLDLFIVNIAFPDIERDFGGASLASLSWILNAYAIVFAALLVPAGRWADAFGRKRMFLSGLAVFVVASAACAAAPSVGLLTAARIVQAVGGAFMMPTSLGLMLPEFEAHERGGAVGIWAATGGAAAAAGPPLGGLLVQADWRLVFLVNVPVGIAGLVFGIRHLVEHSEPGTRRPDLLGALAFALAIGALTVAIVKGGDWGWGSARTVGGFVAAALLLPAVLLRSGRHHTPIIDPEMLRVRSFSLALVGSITFFAGFGSMLLSGVLFTTGVWGKDILTAGLMLAPGPALAASFSVPVGQARRPRRLPRHGDDRRDALLPRRDLLDPAHRQHARVRERLPAGDDPHRDGRRLHAADADGRRRVRRWRRRGSPRASPSSPWAGRSARRSASPSSSPCSARAGRRRPTSTPPGRSRSSAGSRRASCSPALGPHVRRAPVSAAAALETVPA